MGVQRQPLRLEKKAFRIKIDSEVTFFYVRSVERLTSRLRIENSANTEKSNGPINP
ncbi:hypothetical protein ADIS_4109 [Lunatimonas lonarensis]|uniref:Uncharacterized protein n=1 Tax=Lunatimonas lonarensis TaxID=1232681 RepID=R7ZMS8_9BACT|nr:hypothetical protein ADIS_4109 [Lunatimonas lonarensis]